MKKLFSFFMILLMTVAISCNKDSGTAGTGEIYFPMVKTIIQQNCTGCHYLGGAGMPVVLTNDSDIVKNAAAIKSATIDSVTFLNKRMPLDGELSDADKAIIQSW